MSIYFKLKSKRYFLQEQENCTGTKIVPFGLILLLMARRVATKKCLWQRHICSVECCSCLYDNVLFILVQINRNIVSNQMEIGNGKKEGIFLSWCHWALGKINYSFAVIFFFFIMRIFIKCNTMFAAMSWGNGRRNSLSATANDQIVQRQSIQSANNNIWTNNNKWSKLN